MAEHLESLLQKIHDEAVAKADAAAAARLAAAEQRAKEIERAATQRAEALVADAEQRARQHAASGTQALEHAARDVLIYVRQSIMKYFATLFETAVPELVPLERVQDILEQIALEAQKRGRSTEGVKVFVSERDQKALVDFFMHQFRQAVSGGAELHPMKGLRAEIGRAHV